MLLLTRLRAMAVPDSQSIEILRRRA
jgi:hypothetical protein